MTGSYYQRVVRWSLLLFPCLAGPYTVALLIRRSRGEYGDMDYPALVSHVAEDVLIMLVVTLATAAAMALIRSKMKD